MKLKFLSASGALAAMLGVLPAMAQTCGPPPEGSPRWLPLQEAISLALANDLRPETARAEVAAARTEVAIAALRPADSISLEVENFPGLGAASDIDTLEITGTFSRVWERGGKREARATLADRGIALAETGIAISRAEIAYEVQTLYVELALAFERQTLAAEKLGAAKAAETLIARRVEAARDPLLAGSRAAAETLIAESELNQLTRETEALGKALADYWNGAPDFSVSFCALAEPDRHTDHPLNVDQSPEIARIEAERRQSEAAAEAARTERIPDVTWNAGIRKFGIDESVAILGGISIPLGAPKQAAPYEQKAAAGARKLEAQRESLRQSLLRDSARLERTALSALAAIRELESGPIAESERAVELANDGYRRGAFSYLDVLDAQQMLFRLREQRLDHLRSYHLAEAALARIQAANVPSESTDSAQ